ncbi:hypothetical protein JAAARDRAFT_308724 [Jaapia argillacea MUCL 33604]|uniref:Uncharacterized protein n=1 Tax=Jaapia argillacea MUCL 33604 TaxID=933084 RepID=A0A067PNE5_9AGAM|nr:hypothetical protein JAAARDRAFT_308724 [Jaapia argillacea MUCL 33604]
MDSGLIHGRRRPSRGSGATGEIEQCKCSPILVRLHWLPTLSIQDESSEDGANTAEASVFCRAAATRGSGGWIQPQEASPLSTTSETAAGNGLPTFVDPFIRHPKPHKAYAPEWVKQCEFLDVHCEERPPTLGLESPMPYSWPRSEITIVGRTRSRHAKWDEIKELESDQDNIDWTVWPYIGTAGPCNTYESYVSSALHRASKVTSVRSGGDIRGYSQGAVPTARSPHHHHDSSRFMEPISYEDAVNLTVPERSTRVSYLHGGRGREDDGTPRRVAGARIRQQLALLELIVTEMRSRDSIHQQLISIIVTSGDTNRHTMGYV